MARTTKSPGGLFSGLWTERLANLFNPGWFVSKPPAEPVSEFARIREDRKAALNAFRAALERGDTRRQHLTQPAAIQATNAALRGGL